PSPIPAPGLVSPDRTRYEQQRQKRKGNSHSAVQQAVQRVNWRERRKELLALPAYERHHDEGDEYTDQGAELNRIGVHAYLESAGILGNPHLCLAHLLSRGPVRLSLLGE